MTRQVATIPLTQDGIAGFADVIEATGDPDKLINQDQCGRYHDLTNLDILDGRAGISVFSSAVFSLPFTLEMMERHPNGSQAFLPMHQNPYLIVVAPDENGKPGVPKAFIANAGQGINIGRNVWHGVLCPLMEPGLFAVLDRVSDGPNLQEHWFKEPWQIGTT